MRLMLKRQKARQQTLARLAIQLRVYLVVGMAEKQHDKTHCTDAVWARRDNRQLQANHLSQKENGQRENTGECLIPRLARIDCCQVTMPCFPNQHEFSL
jgi:hypothetical protein